MKYKIALIITFSLFSATSALSDQPKKEDSSLPEKKKEQTYIQKTLQPYRKYLFWNPMGTRNYLEEWIFEEKPLEVASKSDEKDKVSDGSTSNKKDEKPTSQATLAVQKNNPTSAQKDLAIPVGQPSDLKLSEKNEHPGELQAPELKEISAENDKKLAIATGTTPSPQEGSKPDQAQQLDLSSKNSNISDKNNLLDGAKDNTHSEIDLPAIPQVANIDVKPSETANKDNEINTKQGGPANKDSTTNQVATSDDKPSELINKEPYSSSNDTMKLAGLDEKQAAIPQNSDSSAQKPVDAQAYMGQKIDVPTPPALPTSDDGQEKNSDIAQVQNNEKDTIKSDQKEAKEVKNTQDASVPSGTAPLVKAQAPTDPVQSSQNDLAAPSSESKIDQKSEEKAQNVQIQQDTNANNTIKQTEDNTKPQLSRVDSKSATSPPIANSATQEKQHVKIDLLKKDFEKQTKAKRGSKKTPEEKAKGETLQQVVTKEKELSPEQKQEIEKFVQDEVTMILLPRDEVVLGELTFEAKIFFTDHHDYIDYFWREYYFLKHQPKVAYMNKYLKAINLPHTKLEADKAIVYAEEFTKKGSINELRVILDNSSVDLINYKTNNISLPMVAINSGQYNSLYLMIMRGLGKNSLSNLGEYDPEMNNSLISSLLKKAGINIL
ncbi:MAG: hypothetical protein SFT91_04945 [Rickettsiaceae bacterium]|nr:hypothetical protein [Rickettsiaceae bacterium]